MDRGELLEKCPALDRALAAEPELGQVLDNLRAHELDGALVSYLADAAPNEVRTFLGECRRADLERILLHRRALRQKAEDPIRLEDVEAVPLVTREEQVSRHQADLAAGLEALRDGHVAALAFAGGSGTRFFSHIGELSQAIDRPNEVLRRSDFDPAEPKGVFPISPVAGLSFYSLIVAEALEAGVQAGRLPWVLFLTSSVTHVRTARYLSEAPLWGFPRDGIIAFQQRDEPRLDPDGQLVVADREGRLAWTGNGHGGVFQALLAPGEGGSILERVRRDGVRHLVMHNIDNAASRPFEAARIGFHVREGAHFTISATRKVDPAEKVGLVMRIRRSGKVEVIEYNVVSPEIAEARDPRSGRLVHEAGNINTNLVAAEAIRDDIEPTLYTGKVIDSRRGPVETSSLEMLNQHLSRLLDPNRVRAFEVDRDEFFMPTKNVTGLDSVESTIRMISRRYALLLRNAGAQIAEDALCDLHPATGGAAALLERAGAGPGWRIGPRARLYLCVREGLCGGPPLSEGLELEEGSSLVIDSERPYGEIALGPDRRLSLDPATASRLSIGRNVKVRRGVRVAIHLAPGARLTIPARRVFAEDIEVIMRPFGELSL